MKHFIVLMAVLCLAFCRQSLFAQCACSTCDFVIDVNTPDYDIDGDSLKQAWGVQSLAGKKFCVKGGTYTNKRVTFRDLEGTLNSQILITNCEGQVVINNLGVPNRNALQLFNVKYVRLLGNGCAASPQNIKYGFRAKSNNNYVEASALTGGRITDVEMAWLEIGADTGYPGAAGVKIIDHPECDADTIRNRNSPSRWVIRNISVHDNYIHNVGNEGIYIGKGDSWYMGDTVVNCPRPSYSVSIKGVRIYNNRVTHTGWDGIQLKDGDADVKIYNNDITYFGDLDVDIQNEGMVLGAGDVGEVFHNRIINGPGWGVFFKGLGNLNLHNNIISNTGDAGIYLNGDQGVTTAASSYIRILNNTIVKTNTETTTPGIAIHNYGDIDFRVLVNNIIAETSSTFVTGSFNERSNNIESTNASQLGFISYAESSAQDFLNNDYHLQQQSAAVNAGKNAAGYGADSITYDYDGKPRNVGGSYDIGCYEYQGQTGGGGTLSLFVNAGSGVAYNNWQADNPHATLDTSFPTSVTGSQSAFGGPNGTSAPLQVLGTYRYTLNSNTTIRYNIPVPASGDYEVELFFARKNADEFMSGARRFNIFIEGQNVTTYDVYDEGGSDGRAASTYVNTATVTDGMLEIKLVAVSGAHAMINAIHVEGPVAGTSMAAFAAARETSMANGVFPNPAHDYINITSVDEEISGVKITDSQNQVYVADALALKRGETGVIDIRHLQGNKLYFVYLRSPKGVRTFKLLKN